MRSKESLTQHLTDAAITGAALLTLYHIAHYSINWLKTPKQQITSPDQLPKAPESERDVGAILLQIKDELFPSLVIIHEAALIERDHPPTTAINNHQSATLPDWCAIAGNRYSFVEAKRLGSGGKQKEVAVSGLPTGSKYHYTVNNLNQRLSMKELPLYEQAVILLGKPLVTQLESET